MTIYDQLARLPDGWGFVAVDGEKRPYQKAWQDNPLTKAKLAAELKAGHARAIGVCCGVPSGGLLFLDHDGKSASTILRDWGCPMSSLPRSWTVTSGRDGRFQVIYQVPQRYWDGIVTRKYKTGITDAEGKPEQVELRWTGCQSVVAGDHPLTPGYRWVAKYSPDDLPIAEAPSELLERMLKPVATAVVLSEVRTGDDDATRARSYLDALSSGRADDYDDWLAVGMALHSVGDDALLDDWEQWSAQSGKHKPSDCQRKWRSFKKSGITLGTLGDMAKKDGWRGSAVTRRTVSTGGAGRETDAPPPIITKPEKLETAELLAFLRSKCDDIRYNIFTQQIEIKEQVVEGADRFYLKLAEMGYKVSKELAIDCLVQVANENLYDPVREYLEWCANTTDPAYIDRLSTAYLRPGDEVQSEPTIYDEMLKRTLIGAVARAFNPGCKHDTACVIMGDQGAYKSFWVIPTTKTQQDQINTAALLLERDAIWSAAVKMYPNTLSDVQVSNYLHLRRYWSMPSRSR
jgi:hypothetical protein